MVMIILRNILAVLMLGKGDIFTFVKGKNPRLLPSENEGYVRDERY